MEVGSGVVGVRIRARPEMEEARAVRMVVSRWIGVSGIRREI